MWKMDFCYVAQCFPLVLHLLLTFCPSCSCLFLFSLFLRSLNFWHIFPWPISSLSPTKLVLFLLRAEVLVEYEYDALHDDELTLRPGDIIRNVRHIEEEGWMEGELNGKRGLFPDNFVKVKENIDFMFVFSY